MYIYTQIHTHTYKYVNVYVYAYILSGKCFICDLDNKRKARKEQCGDRKEEKEKIKF